jgi:hypothetical protein
VVLVLVPWSRQKLRRKITKEISFIFYLRSRIEKNLMAKKCNLNWDLRPAVLLPAAASASSLAQQRHVHLPLQVDDHVLLLLLLGQEEWSS